jgi:hypothetical protein
METTDRDDEPPAVTEAVARCAAMFDATDDRRIPNGIDRLNAYAGSCHRPD